MSRGSRKKKGSRTHRNKYAAESDAAQERVKRELKMMDAVGDRNSGTPTSHSTSLREYCSTRGVLLTSMQGRDCGHYDPGTGRCFAPGSRGYCPVV